VPWNIHRGAEVIHPGNGGIVTEFDPLGVSGAGAAVPNEMPARPGIHRRSAVPDTQRTGVFIGRGIGGRAVSRRRLCSVGTPCSRAPAAIAAGTPPARPRRSKNVHYARRSPT